MLPKAIIVDLDGTLAMIGSRSPYDAALCELDEINSVVRDIALRWHTSVAAYGGGDILLTSGRQEIHRPQTERWLRTHKFPYTALWMRQTGDPRKDSVIKREMFEDNVRGRWNIDFVLDDRTQVVQMWRHELGLICLQVADGDF